MRRRKFLEWLGVTAATAPVIANTDLPLLANNKPIKKSGFVGIALQSGNKGDLVDVAISPCVARLSNGCTIHLNGLHPDMLFNRDMALKLASGLVESQKQSGEVSFE